MYADGDLGKHGMPESRRYRMREFVFYVFGDSSKVGYDVSRVGMRLKSIEPIIRDVLDLVGESQEQVGAVTVLGKPTENGHFRLVVTSSLSDDLLVSAMNHATASLGLLYRPVAPSKTNRGA